MFLSFIEYHYCCALYLHFSFNFAHLLLAAIDFTQCAAQNCESIRRSAVKLKQESRNQSQL